MPATRQASRRASRTAQRPFPVPTAARIATRQAAEETRLSEQLLRYGCLWEEHAHHIRTKEKNAERLATAYARAMQRWTNDPEFSRGRSPMRNYQEEKGAYIEWTEAAIAAYCKPIAEMSIEDHCIVSFAAFSAYNVINANELSMKYQDRLRRLKCNVSNKLYDSAKAYQDSEPDFLNHPADPQGRGAAAPLMGPPNIGSPALLGAVIKYRTAEMRRHRSCMVVGLSMMLGGGVEYSVEYLSSNVPGDRKGKKVTLSEDKFRKIWDARVRD